MLDLIAATVAKLDLGKPTAAKRGRNPAFPYVPVIQYATRTHQVPALALKTREEAVEAAAAAIEYQRKVLAARLAEPRHRSLRRQHGLPEEVAA